MLRPLFSLAAAGLLIGGAASAQVLVTSDMSSLFEVPINASMAKGFGSGSFAPGTSTLTISMSLTGMVGTAAHVHTGAVGVAGGILIPMGGVSPMFSGSMVLGAASVTALLHEGLYFNAHSAALPVGEIRQQLRIARNYYSRMNGANETPPNPSLATGDAVLTLNQPAGTLTYNVSVTGMAPTAAHIHIGAAGVMGGILIPMTQTGATTFAGTSAALSDANLILLATEGLYVNVHSAAFPGGEIRDQTRVGNINGGTDFLSVARGGTQTMSLAFGAANAGNLYLTLGSLAGTMPGIPSPPFVLPLNIDAYFLQTLTSPNSALLSTSFGGLSSSGAGTTRFNLPPAAPAILIGMTVNHATVCLGFPSLAVVAISQPLACTFVP